MLPTMPAMPRHREESAVSARPSGAALPLALGAAAIVAALLSLKRDVGGAFAALALLLTAAGCLLAGALWARQRLQARLHDARQQQQLLLQMTDAWVWQTDTEHRLVRLRPPAGAPASSWAEGAFSGQLLWERFAPADTGLQARMQAFAVVPELRLHQVQASLSGTAPGPRSWCLRGQPRFDSHGGFAGYLGLARPADEADAHAEEREGLTALAAEHASFSYTVSHDLRAPIRVVEGFARILKEDYGHTLDRIGNDHLDRVLGAAARMNSMIDALLSLSQLSTQPLLCEPVNLSELAQYVVDDLRRMAPEREAEIRIEAGLETQGDPTLLRMALENLIGNAWKYSGKTARAQIAFEQCQHAGRKAFVVRDNGAGFDMRFADRLFSVFQRLHSSGDFQGTGVGLASVRRVIRRHGGEIWAESEVGKGANFYFTLKA
jgi:signal transduction histidine kinase